MDKIISRKQAQRLIKNNGAFYEVVIGGHMQTSVSHDVCSTVTDSGRDYGVLTDPKGQRIFWVDAKLK